ncbi:MAG: aminodeoxychorismate/anthranilate synthase component II [Elusimicrobia bacterium]|nr:aminodeoxychorismate/anthranilate synthase component II [Elusimicrobiota bacterium]
MILLIDNYDSFVYNLYQYMGSINPDITGKRNNEITIKEIEQLNPEKIILSPGPGKPSDAGICIDLIKHFAGKIPIFGVCLGHQAICEAFGATVSYAKELMHGKQSEINIDTTCPIFKDFDNKIVVGRYHSLAALKETIPAELSIVASSNDGEVMAVWHKKFNIFGVQFHPESVLTPKGYDIIKNFLRG